MNFKKEYQEAFSGIRADEDFKKRVAKKLNETERRKVKPAYVGGLVAAVVMLLVVGAGAVAGLVVLNPTQDPSVDNSGMVLNNSEITPDTSIQMNTEVAAQTDMSETFPEMNFSGLSWYGKAEGEELLGIFVSYLQDETLDTVYSADNADLAEATVLDADEVALLTDKIGGAESSDVEPEGECHYYKAVFESGLTIKFCVWHEGYLRLEDTGSIYQLH